MQKIDFVNGQKPALNEENLNLMQLYIEQAINAQVSGDTFPIGAIISYPGETAPTNWLICDGTEVSRTEYKNLFSIIGTTFGEGDGSTTFNLPNIKGRDIVGLDPSDSNFNAIGKTGGERLHKLTIDEMPKHNHYSTKSHQRVLLWDANIFSLGGLSSGSTVQSNWDQLQTDYTGESKPHNNMQPYMTTNYIIKVNQSAGLVANISNTKTESLKDSYSCNYINKIIESGSDSNGSWVKYSDGTMICNHAISGTSENTDYWGQFYRTNSLKNFFPQEFVSIPTINISVSSNGGALSGVVENVTTKSVSMYIIKPKSDIISTEYKAYYTATGRWK